MQSKVLVNAMSKLVIYLLSAWEMKIQENILPICSTHCIIKHIYYCIHKLPLARTWKKQNSVKQPKKQNDSILSLYIVIMKLLVVYGSDLHIKLEEIIDYRSQINVHIFHFIWPSPITLVSDQKIGPAARISSVSLLSFPILWFMNTSKFFLNRPPNLSSVSV